ncbi:MAG: SEC-C metal-binding domain-containing protein [Limnochordia bacterium]|jgi:hypothetical protein|nr:SEC-C domain-containing protein [Limnochordia bacterium]MDD2628953.1 SEC-C metal-binding domain-containing protein [Limnochordia bacterium]MDD4516915.1 SEC-C metal-binding domain-containing protein [Limnochordia bacterium]
MLAYGVITGKDSDVVLAGAEFSDIDSLVLIVDHYCLNPLCSCEDAVLEFLAHEESLRRLFLVSVDLKTWAVTKKEVNGVTTRVYNKILQEFTSGILPDVKDDILERRQKARQYGRENPAEFIPVQTIADQGTIGYAELHPEANPVIFRMGDTEYLVDDQYCSDPKCPCESVVLSFIDLKRRRPSLAINMKLNPRGRYDYEILDCSMPHRQVAAFVDSFMREKGSHFPEFKRRYDELNAIGAEVLRKNRVQPPRRKTKVGRNDPCICGSGKKYKHCCGK